MSNQRVVNFALLGFTAILILAVSSLLDQLWVQFEWPDQTFIGGVNYPVLAAVVISAVASLLVRRDHRANTFLTEAVDELRQVAWPTRQEVVDSTKVVIIATVFLAVVLGGFDLVWAKIARAILQ